MNEEYLWDRSGEPDPEIERLEEILGTLRYQPQALEIPEKLIVERRRNLRSLLAIAATLILTVMAAGLWFQLRTEKSSSPQQAEGTPIASPGYSYASPPTLAWVSWRAAVSDQSKATHSPKFVAINVRRERTASTLKAAELAEALKAKEQLLIALRLTSEKLNFAQKKAQHPTTPNQIRNQHKIG